MTLVYAVRRCQETKLWAVTQYILTCSCHLQSRRAREVLRSLQPRSAFLHLIKHKGKMLICFQITCLFWFESSATLNKIESFDLSSLLDSGLVPEAQPAISYLKWVTTILSTTQVTQNVILLALLFIYRLKRQNPTVRGKLGSEFRLLTVALMLGNKCRSPLPRICPSER